MVPILPLSIPPDGPLGRREDRISRELRAYLRAEYNADEHWLFAQNHTVRGSIRVRVHDWLRRLRSLRNPLRRTRAGESTDRGLRESVGEAPLPHPFEAAIDRSTCPHSLREPLGSAGNASYFRCIDCGTVLIAQDTRMWILRAPSSDDREAARELLGRSTAQFPDSQRSTPQLIMDDEADIVAP